MATDTAPAEQTDAQAAQTTGENQPAPETAETKRKRERPEGGYLYISTPKALRDAIDKAAEEQKTSAREVVVNLLAEKFNVEIPKPVVRTKYASDEERKEAQKAQRQTKADLLKLAMEKFGPQMEALMKELEAKKAAEANSETPATA